MWITEEDAGGLRQKLVANSLPLKPTSWTSSSCKYGAHCAQPAGSHVAHQQLRCLLHGNDPAIPDALRACSAGSPVGSHVAYKQLCCLLHGNVRQGELKNGPARPRRSRHITNETMAGMMPINTKAGRKHRPVGINSFTDRLAA